MTDNLALLFTVGAVDQLERFRGTGAMSSFVVSAGCIAAAMLTRQSSAFLLGVALVYRLLDVYRHRRWTRASVGSGALLPAFAPAAGARACSVFWWRWRARSALGASESPRAVGVWVHISSLFF